MADLLAVKELDYVAIDSITNELLEVDGDKVSIVEQVPQIIEAQSTAIELVIINDEQSVIYASEPLAYVSDVCAGGSGIDLYDEGTLIAKGVTSLNFVGDQVKTKDEGSGRATIFIPTPSYVSHFNSNDGLSDAIIPDLTVYNRYVAIPTTEGAPFAIGDWAEKQIHQVLQNGTLLYQPGAACSFYNAATTLTVTILGTDGSSTLYTYTTPTIAANGVHLSNNNAIIVTISGWNLDVDRWQAQVSILINTAILLPEGGRFGVSIQHSNSTDGTYYKVQNHLFYDSNTLAATINNTSITQKWATSSKYLSGLRYYTLWDQFTIGAYGLDNINSNSYPQIVVASSCSDFGIDDLQIPADALQNWTSQWDQQDAFYEGDHPITKQSHRFVGSAHITTGAIDWGVAKTVASPPSFVLIDTYPTTSDPLVENFDDEYHRQKPDFNSGLPYGNWLPDQPLQQGDAMVFGGRLIAPSEAHTIDNNPPEKITTWYNYLPLNESGMQNPDYSTLTCPINYYRTFLAPDPAREVPNWQIYVEGEFVNGNVNADIESGLIEIYIRRVGSTMTENVGPTATPMTVHGIGYSLGDFDDGVTNGCIRTGNSAGTMIGCTSGGLATTIGIHFHIRIFDPLIKLNSIVLEFN